MRYVNHRCAPLRASRLCLAVLALTGGMAGNVASAQDTQVDRTDSQLIVLFDPTSKASPSPGTLIAAFDAQQPRKAGQRASLGAPLHAEKTLRDLQPLAADAAAAPLAPRALLDRYVTLTYATPAQAAFAKAMLAADPQVLSVEQNRHFRYAAPPSDAFFMPAAGSSPPSSYQWGMHAMNFPAAWDKERGFAYIAAIDSGIPRQIGTGIIHPDLQQNYRVQFSQGFRPGWGTDIVHDGLGHGSHVAGIMSAAPQYGPFHHNPADDGVAGGFTDLDRSTGVAGACWTCSLSMLAFNAMDVPNAALAITFAADHGMQAANMSFGDSYDDPAYSSCATGFAVMCTAISYAAQRQLVLVGATGNRNDNRVQFPANQPDVIAVGGIQYSSVPMWSGGPLFKGKFWDLGYGNGNPCSAGVKGDECGSNYGSELHVVAPAKDVISTIGLGLDFGATSYSDYVKCGDQWPSGTSTLDYYGTCTGTSMAAPHVTGLVGLLRSANPLADPFAIRAWVASYTTGCEAWDLKCGAGIPNAALSVQAALGHANAINRSTPLFAFYNTDATDHFYTTVPQMAASALLKGKLLPQPPLAINQSAYAAIGVTLPAYTAFPLPPCTFSPCPSNTPKAIANIMTTHVSPVDGTDLTPLYRYSFACEQAGPAPCANPKHISHVYATNPNYASSYHPTEHAYWTSGGYKLDGIEGYVFPKEKQRPPGTVKLCRKYDATRDDYVLFVNALSDKVTCAGNTDGYTGGDYQPIAGIDWIGYVYPPADAQPLCPGSAPCS